MLINQGFTFHCYFYLVPLPYSFQSHQSIIILHYFLQHYRFPFKFPLPFNKYFPIIQLFVSINHIRNMFYFFLINLRGFLNYI